jgi:hypothetical protein
VCLCASWTLNALKIKGFCARYGCLENVAK